MVGKIIIHKNLSEKEAFAAEAALINAFNYNASEEKPKLTNIVSGHHSIGAMSTSEIEQLYGAQELTMDDIKHKILVVKINTTYRKDMTAEDLYDAVRGIWGANYERAQKIDYVFGVYNSLVVAVYKPSKWYFYKDAPEKMKRHDLNDLKISDRDGKKIFFVSEAIEQDVNDDNVLFYQYKSIANLPGAKSQNFTYLN